MMAFSRHHIVDLTADSDSEPEIMLAAPAPRRVVVDLHRESYSETKFEVAPRVSSKRASNCPSPISSRSHGVDTTPTKPTRVSLASSSHGGRLSRDDASVAPRTESPSKPSAHGSLGDTVPARTTSPSSNLPLRNSTNQSLKQPSRSQPEQGPKQLPTNQPNQSPKQAMPGNPTLSTLTPKHQTPKHQTPRRYEVTVDQLEEELRSFCFKDVRRAHGKLVQYTLQSTARMAPPQRRHLSKVADLADLKLDPVVDPVSSKSNTMKVKLKQHGRDQPRSKHDQKGHSYAYEVACIKTDKERVPKYRFHHVEISKNILTPHTMLKFVPHLRDLEKNEEAKYSRWIKELEAMDAQSGFKANSLDRPQKIAKTKHEEMAAELSLYIERWIARLGLDNCNKSTLIRYMASQEERDDKMTPQQKSSLLNSYSDDIGSPHAIKSAKLFTEAFDRVYESLGVTLSHVLHLDESVETIVDSKKWVKDGKVDNPGGEELVEMVEYWLQSYTILGCLVCYSHSCEHGEYDVDNQKRTFSVDTIGKYGNLLKQRRVRELWAKAQNQGGQGLKQYNPCKNQCYKNYDVGNLNAHVEPWTESETMLLRCLFASLGEGNIKPACAGAVLLSRRCWDVYRKLRELDLSLPELDVNPEPPKIKAVNWYDRNRKMLMGDWQDMTVSHEHARREIFDPCRHEGPCGPSTKCPCWKNGILCERFCRCTPLTCPIKFTGCACHSTGKTCLQRKQDGRPCICVQLNRECDPVLCAGCGARERADPQSCNDDLLHATGCQNVSLQRGKQKAVVLGKSQLEGCGYGLFTAQDIHQDEFVIEYKGELITHDEGVRREARRGDVFDEGSSSSYLFTLLEQEGIWVDAAIYGNLSRYINHAGEHDKRGCNITPKILYVNGEFRIRFSALRDIRAGEELFFNYGENFPNLTQKLLDSKEADEEEAAAAAAPAGKGKGGRPRRQDGKPVARKSTAARKKSAGARKEAPEASAETDLSFWDLDKLVDDEDEDPMYKPSGYKPRKPRKRKRGGARGGGAAAHDDLEDAEDVEYRPGESLDDVDSGAVSEAARKPRGRRTGRSAGRRRQPSEAAATEDSDAPLVPDAVPATPRRYASRRGGPKPSAPPDMESDEPLAPAAGGGGRKRKRKRKRVVDTEDDEDGRPPGGGNHSGHSDRWAEGEGGEEGEEEEGDDDDDNDDEDDRSRRKRQKPLRYRNDG